MHLSFIRLFSRRAAAGAAAVAPAIILVFVFLLPGGNAASAQSPCDPALPRNDAQSSGYRLRGDRCEGIYKRPVASFGVQLVSLTAGNPVDLCGAGAVHMVWPAGTTLSGSRTIHLQAESLRPLLYYRLDLDRPAGESSYEWPADPRCNNDVALRPADLGVIARTSAMLGGRSVDVLLPVALSRQPDAPVRPPYYAVLMPGGRLREVYVSLSRYGTGTTPAVVFTDRPLAMRPYPAGTRVRIPINAADVSQPGLYRVRASVEFDTGAVEAMELYFLHGR